MFERKINRIELRNFKCHKDVGLNFGDINIFTGANAAGKSSIIQALLLAFKSWEEYEKKSVNANQVYGLNLGLPINILSENREKNIIEIVLQIGSCSNRIELSLPSEDEEDIFFRISNSEEIAEQNACNCSLKKKNMIFLNAERQGPRIVSFIKENSSYSVGNIGENTAYVISEMDKLQKLNGGFKLPKELKSSKIERFSANCEEWLNVIIPDTGIQYSVDMERNLTTLRFKNKGELYLPVSTGFGITYVFPIIVQALAASVIENSILIVENPEAHLHPLSQSMLGKFLALAALSGVQLFIETHSEHIIDGCRIQMAKMKKCEQMKIFFFEKEGNTSLIHEINVFENGELEEWPEGFFDQKQMDLRELLEMRRCQK